MGELYKRILYMTLSPRGRIPEHSTERPRPTPVTPQFAKTKKEKTPSPPEEPTIGDGGMEDIANTMRGHRRLLQRSVEGETSRGIRD